MKKLTVIALTLLAAGASMANGLTREEVVAELVRARNAGELTVYQSENPEAFGRSLVATGSPVSRAAVLADLQRARQSGELARRDSESYSGPVVSIASIRSRAEVLAELDAARASGELDILNSNNPDSARLAAVKPVTAQILAGQPKTAQ
jgi:Domain of unknown function (DUF4148)